jgi:hypothetical protein
VRAPTRSASRTECGNAGRGFQSIARERMDRNRTTWQPIALTSAVPLGQPSARFRILREMNLDSRRVVHNGPLEVIRSLGGSALTVIRRRQSSSRLRNCHGPCIERVPARHRAADCALRKRRRCRSHGSEPCCAPPESQPHPKDRSYRARLAPRRCSMAGTKKKRADCARTRSIPPLSFAMRW